MRTLRALGALAALVVMAAALCSVAWAGDSKNLAPGFKNLPDDAKKGATGTNAPQVVKDKVIVGVSGGEFGVQGHIDAYSTKDGKLAWSFADAFKPLEDRTGARYGLFMWVRDGYASASRKATIVITTILTLGHYIPGAGQQSAYASLVDLDSGRE